MIKKRMGLIFLVGVCFLACFSYLNQKYDRFNRIEGIDNEKRQLILFHLDEDEQEYLIEQSFHADRFMKYIEIEGFSIYDLVDYEIMAKSGRSFLNEEHLVTYTNQILKKLRTLTTRSEREYFKKILNNNLDTIFLQSENFRLDLIEFYSIYHQMFSQVTMEQLDLLNQINDQMNALDYYRAQKNGNLKTWLQDYSLVAISTFLEAKLQNPEYELIAYPESLTTLITSNQSISTYVPEPLSIPSDVSRVSFGMYLRQDACVALEKMYNDLIIEIKDEKFLLVKAYQSYETQQNSYLNEESSLMGGENEFQLGLSIDVMVMNQDYDLFSETKVCQFLKENSWKYGFIQRYASVEDENYNDHIYRYVGQQAAKVIYENQMTLEEYEGV